MTLPVCGRSGDPRTPPLPRFAQSLPRPPSPPSNPLPHQPKAGKLTDVDHFERFVAEKSASLLEENPELSQEDAVKMAKEAGVKAGKDQQQAKVRGGGVGGAQGEGVRSGVDREGAGCGGMAASRTRAAKRAR